MASALLYVPRVPELLISNFSQISWQRDPLLRLINDPIIWGPVGTALGVYLFFRGFFLLKRKRLLVDTPQSTVRSAALGPVEVRGQATGPYTLVSPLSKTDCYFYRLATTHLKENVRKNLSIEECAPLFVNDGTGNLLIDPRGAEIQFPPSATQESGFIPDYLRHFLIQHGIPLQDLVKVEEFCIRPEDKIVIFGTLQENPWAKAAREGQESLGRIGPGFLSKAAADVQRRAAFECLDTPSPASPTLNSQSEFDLYPPAILMKGASPFFISNNTEQELVQTLGLKCSLYIWGGPL